MNSFERCIVSVVGVALPSIANAYIEPGASSGSITTVLVLAGIALLVIAGLLWFPLKRLFSKEMKEGKKKE